MRRINPYTFEGAQKAWSNPPVDNVGYRPAAAMLELPDAELLRIIEEFETARYNLAGWRNYKNLWRKVLGLDTTTDKTILDFGCGVGIEALQFKRADNEVILADIVAGNLELAERVLNVSGYEADGICVISGEHPFFRLHKDIDIFYANGVLHHTPDIRGILKEAVKYLKPEGEIRLMLYSDKGFKHACRVAPGPRTLGKNHPRYKRFVRFFDGVGHYADWYDRDKIEWLFGDFLDIKKFEYITMKHDVFGMYLAVVLTPKGE